MTQNRKLIGNAILLTAAIVWGFAFSAQSAAGALLPPFSVNSLRFYIGCLVLIPATVVADSLRHNGRRLLSRQNAHFLGITKTEWIAGGLCGAILFAASAFQQLGLSSDTEAGNAAFITALYIVIVPLISRFLGKRPGVRAVMCALVALLGFYVMTAEPPTSSGVLPFLQALRGGFHPTSGDLLVLVCAVIFSFHIIAIDAYSGRADGFRISMIQFLTAALLGTPFMMAEGLSVSAVTSAFPYLLYLGVMSCGVAYTAQIIGQAYAPPTIASMILSLESVFGMIGGVLFLGERPTVTAGVGAALVFTAIIVSQLPGKQSAGINRKSTDNNG